MTDAWDRLELRYLAGLRVTGDRRAGAFANALLYAWGAMVWWSLAPVVPVWGFKRHLLWATSAFLAYLALRCLAVIEASNRWLSRLALARHVAPGRRRGDRRPRRGSWRARPLARVRARRVEVLA